MHSFLKSTFKIAVAIGFFVLPVGSAQAQSSGFLPGGNISIGSNGPTATFNTGSLGNSVLGGQGTAQIGPQGSGFRFNANSVAGSRTFSGSTGQQGFQSTQSGPFGQQGAQNSGFFGGASGGGADYRNSSGDTGVYGRESIRSQGNWYGQTDRSRASNDRLWNRAGQRMVTTTKNTALSSFQINNSIPSGSYSYGFQNGWAARASSALGRAGFGLPTTSTSSVDLNIVDY